MIVNIIFVLLVSMYIKKRKSIELWLSDIPVHYFLIGILGLLSSALVLVYVIIGREDSTNNVWDKVTVLSSGIICTFFIVGSLSYAYIHDSKKRLEEQDRLNKKLIDIQQNYYQQIINNDVEVRRLSHDMASHIGCMKVLLREGKLDERSSYMGRIINDVDSTLRRKINSGNDTIDAILNYLYQLIDEDEIDINLHGRCRDMLLINGPDLSIIISNTVVNAIEACKVIKKLNKKPIDITIQSNKNSLYISVENPVSSTVDINLLKRGTNKKDKKNHGYGIGNIERVVNKYNGNIDYRNEEGKFIIEILLWF